MDSNYKYTMVPPESIKGLEQIGNIDLYNRPKVRNEDGSISTVRSISFADDYGREILIPTVRDDGYIMSDDEALSHFIRTGKHLGIFESIEAANEYAERLHEAQEKYYADSEE